MPTPIESSLSTLVPTLDPLPASLVQLAASLLVQSRTKAATLKPEEEIGRTYACCHIACQRLGHRLGLEIARPTPPVSGRVYEKLRGFLNSVLGVETPKRATRGGLEGGTKGGIGGTPGSRVRGAETEGESPSLRRAEVKQASAATTPGSRKRKVNVLDDGATPTPKAKVARVEATRDIVAEDVPEDVEEEPEDEDDEDVDVAAVKRPAKTPLRRKEKHVDVDDLGAAGLLPGLGTMFQPAVDWLSDDRRSDYARWKKTILREVAAVEAKG